MVRFVMWWAVVTVAAALLDAAVAVAAGYAFRVMRPQLLLWTLAPWAAYGAGAAVLLAIAERWRGRRIRTWAAPLLLAYLPVLVGAVVRGLFLPALFAHAAALGVLALLWWAQRRPAAARGARGVAYVALAAGVVAAGLALWPALPGRSLLTPPRDPPGPSAAVEAPNVLLIVLDTVRADHLPSYGYRRETMPHLDAFARRATLYEQAVAPSSWTLPSHASLFTGLHPRSHGADTSAEQVGVMLETLGRGAGDQVPVSPLSEEVVTLAELLGELGMETGAVCGNTSYLYRVFGLAQGFETYVDERPLQPRRRPLALALWARLFLGRRDEVRRALTANEVTYLRADEVTDLALTWLAARRERRFFLFVNYMDAHYPFVPAGSYAHLYPAAARHQRIDAEAIRGLDRTILPDERASLTDRYDAELRFVDDELGRLLQRLESWGELERTLVVVVGDHGEALGEHHDLYHNNGAYETVVRVPLLVRRPGQQRAAREDRWVSLVSVFPTVLAAVHLPPPAGLQAAPLENAAQPHPPVTYTARWLPYAQAHPERYDRDHWAVYADPYKLIARTDGTRELYDLRRDPAERSDLSAAQPERVADLEAALARFQREVQPLFSGPDYLNDPEALERLKSLGYLGN